jgi:hypothetical protein
MAQLEHARDNNPMFAPTTNMESRDSHYRSPGPPQAMNTWSDKIFTKSLKGGRFPLVDDFPASNESMKELDEVAEAMLYLMSSDTPKRRYMVTPNAYQAEMTIRSAMQRHSTPEAIPVTLD